MIQAHEKAWVGVARKRILQISLCLEPIRYSFCQVAFDASTQSAIGCKGFDCYEWQLASIEQHKFTVDNMNNRFAANNLKISDFEDMLSLHSTHGLSIKLFAKSSHAPFPIGFQTDLSKTLSIGKPGASLGNSEWIGIPRFELE